MAYDGGAFGSGTDNVTVPLPASGAGSPGTSHKASPADHRHGLPAGMPRVLYNRRPNFTLLSSLSAQFPLAGGVAVPAGVMGTTGSVRIRMLTSGSGAGQRNLGVKISASATPGGTDMAFAVIAAVNQNGEYDMVIHADGSASAQISSARPVGSANAVALGVGAINTAVQWYLHPYGQKITAGDTMTIHTIMVMAEPEV